MRLALSAFVLGSVASQSIFGNIFEEGSADSQSDYDMANAAADKLWEEANCVMHCSDENLPAGEKGQCIMKDMRCDGKKDCTGGEDEGECPSDDAITSEDGTNSGTTKFAGSHGPGPDTAEAQAEVDHKPKPENKRPTPPNGAFRGRFPSFYAPQESAYRQFNEPEFAIFQRRNRKMLQHVTGKQDNERLNQMMKMMFYITEGKMSMANYMSYGCHCNVDGSGHGASQDEIDSVCSRNAGCRKCAATDFTCNPNTSYLVNGAIAGRLDGLACINRPDTCARALCECDLQMIKDLISNKNDWSKDLHSYHGFDQTSSCSSFNSGLFAKSLQNSINSPSSSNAAPQCCGTYPNRLPINGEGRSCCGEKTYNKGHFECCAGSDIVPIGSC